MIKVNLRKKIGIIFVYAFLLTIFPSISLAQDEQTCQAETQAKTEACSQGDDSMTLAQKLEIRRNCDEATLKLDQCNLNTIRQNEDVTNAAQLCRSEYSPETGDSQSSGGQFVPVHETGELLTLSSGINQYSGKSYEMNIKLCMYLHAVKRVQYAMEDLLFVQEPDMRRLAATKIEEYKQGLLGPEGLIKTGYSPSGEITEPATETTPGSDTQGGEPLYPKNLKTYTNQSKEEATGILLDNLKQSGNIFKEQVSGQLKINDTIEPKKLFDSTITKEDYNKVISGDTTISNDKWWNIFTEIFDPTRPNNPYTAYSLTKNKLDIERQRAEELAIKEYEAGGGFLPVRKCVVYTQDGRYCRVWETDTPGQIIKETASDALGSKLEQYLDPALGKIADGNEPNPIDVATFTPTPGTGGGSATEGNTSNSNGNDNGNGNGNGNGNNNNENPRPTAPPAVFFNAEDLVNNTRKISWNLANVRSCVAKNNWLGTTDDLDQLVTIVKSQGTPLTVRASNELIFPLPFKFIATWSKNDGPFIQTGLVSSQATSTIDYTWTISAPSNSRDTYVLNIQDATNPNGFSIRIGGENSLITPLTARRVVEMFKNYQTANPNSAIYRRYKFTYNSTSQSPNIKIELINPKYEITCIGTNGSSVSVATEVK